MGNNFSARYCCADLRLLDSALDIFAAFVKNNELSVWQAVSLSLLRATRVCAMMVIFLNTTFVPPAYIVITT